MASRSARGRSFGRICLPSDSRSSFLFSLRPVVQSAPLTLVISTISRTSPLMTAYIPPTDLSSVINDLLISCVALYVWIVCCLDAITKTQSSWVVELHELRDKLRSADVLQKIVIDFDSTAYTHAIAIHMHAYCVHSRGTKGGYSWGTFPLREHTRARARARTPPSPRRVKSRRSRRSVH